MARLARAGADQSEKRRKQQRLNAKREEQAKRLQAKIEAWFEEFDKDQNGELERDELRHLLSHLFPEHPPDETWLDTLIERATAIESYSLQIRGDKDGAVSKLAVAKAVERYGAYTRQQTLLDDIFGTHDVDKSGLLEKTEVLAMLNDLVQKTPNLKHITADDGDVEWVLEHCDQDQDQSTVTRQELYQALASWKELAQMQANEPDAPAEAPAEAPAKRTSEAAPSAPVPAAQGSTKVLAPSKSSSKACVLL